MSDQDKASGTADGAGDQSNDAAKLREELNAERAARTKAEQAAKDLAGELEALQPYVNFGTQKPQADATANAQESDIGDPVSKELEAMRASLGQIKTDLFFSQNPDLQEMEDVVFAKFQKTDQRKPVELRLKEAAKQTREFVAGLREKVVKDAEAEKAKAKQKEAEAGGIMDATSTAPEKKVEDTGFKGEGDYAAYRRQKMSIEASRSAGGG